MAKKTSKSKSSIPALKVSQWLEEWEEIRFDKKVFQAKPQQHFYLFSLSASVLKSLTGVYRRSTSRKTPRAKDPNVQRGHEQQRSKTIKEFVKYGYPWCEMSEANRSHPEADTLRKPGWLPTSIIVNILNPGESRNDVKISTNDVVKVESQGDFSSIILPKSFSSDKWEPTSIYPLEVIDGQHRLWAFEDFEPGDDYELPVVAYHGLDRSWQAYLFWSVNITPKRINRSLAFDLYPLLRREDWLNKFTGHSIYRETRCQELVESLWSHPDSPWHERINMLGETSKQRDSDAPMVSQAAWIRSLMSSFVKSWAENSPRIGGLFGAARKSDEITLPWNRVMQAAFLIFSGQQLLIEINKTKMEWAKHLRSLNGPTLFDDDDDAFYGKYSLLMTDQGIRGFLYILNDLCYAFHEELDLMDWYWEDFATGRNGNLLPATDLDAVSLAIKSLKKLPVAKFVTSLCKALAQFDWRTSATPNLPEDERSRKLVFRGSGGYREIRKQLLKHLENSQVDVRNATLLVEEALGF